MYGLRDIWRKSRWWLITAFLCGVCFIAFCWFRIEICTRPLCYERIDEIPHNKVGLVLGTSRFNRKGGPNLFFRNRMDAAAALYLAGKVDYLLVSGDNHISYYDEPEDMKKALIERGVPASRIVCDYAGFRTFDSVVRLKKVFREDKATIISQEYHNQRALYIARSQHIQAVAFNAGEVYSASVYFRYIREVLARVMAIIDIHILGTQPHFLGDPVYIG